jgi:hypothetical protein
VTLTSWVLKAVEESLMTRCCNWPAARRSTSNELVMAVIQVSSFSRFIITSGSFRQSFLVFLVISGRFSVYLQPTILIKKLNIIEKHDGRNCAVSEYCTSGKSYSKFQRELQVRYYYFSVKDEGTVKFDLCEQTTDSDRPNIVLINDQ